MSLLKIVFTARHNLGAIFLALIFLVCGLGCAVGPDFEEPAAPKVSSYTEDPLPKKTAETKGLKGGEAQEFKMGEALPQEWWTLYHSPELNELIERGLKNSPDLKSAKATLGEAQEDLRALVGATMYPNVGAEIDAGREQLSSFDSLEGSPTDIESDFPVQILSLYNVDLNVTYVLDVFGGNRRAIEALQAEVDYERYQMAGTYLALTANIVTTAITEASFRAQIEATKSIIDMEEKQLEILKKQHKAGGVSEIEVLAQETLVAQERATLPPLENSLAQTRHALAVLVGEYPGTKSLPELHMDDLHLPTELPVSLPSTVVKQRPDIMGAEALLHQASANIGVATANLLPTFPLVAGYGFNSDTTANFFSPDDLFWNWEAQVLQTLFAGGSLWAQRRSAIEAFESAFAQYQLAVLTGFQNVADSLTALEADARTLKESAWAEKAAKQNLNLVQKQLKAGGVNYLDVILAEIQYQETYMDRIVAQAARYADTAALFQSLGGGWWNEIDDEGEDEDDNE